MYSGSNLKKPHKIKLETFFIKKFENFCFSVRKSQDNAANSDMNMVLAISNNNEIKSGVVEYFDESRKTQYE